MGKKGVGDDALEWRRCVERVRSIAKSENGAIKLEIDQKKKVEKRTPRRAATPVSSRAVVTPKSFKLNLCAWDLLFFPSPHTHTHKWSVDVRQN